MQKACTDQWQQCEYPCRKNLCLCFCKHEAISVFLYPLYFNLHSISPKESAPGLLFYFILISSAAAGVSCTWIKCHVFELRIKNLSGREGSIHSLNPQLSCWLESFLTYRNICDACLCALSHIREVSFDGVRLPDQSLVFVVLYASNFQVFKH